MRLLDPPFDRTPREPGYIKAYPPGIRENGGQYTHAASWLALAFARTGDGDGAKALFDRINPIQHAATARSAAHYRTEPYVVAADIAGMEPHLGRGGWTWYTGAAAWTWRLAVEEILGVRLVGGELQVRPVLPRDWESVELTLRRGRGSIHVTIETDDTRESEEPVIEVEGTLWDARGIPFPENDHTRIVVVRVAQRA